MPEEASYNPEGTDIAHGVLMEVLTALGTYVERGEVILVGGFAPYQLLKESPRTAEMPMHIGSNDVDLLLNFNAIKNEDYGTIRKALEGAGFMQRTASGQDFMWDKMVPGGEGGEVTVTVDLLAPKEGGTGKKRRHQRVQDDLPLRKIDGGEMALESTVTMRISGKLLDGSRTAHKVKVASAAAVVAMKGLIVGNRRKERDPRKDAYDLYMLITWYKEGPKSVAEEVRPLLNHDLMRRAIENIRLKFETTDSVGPKWAGEMAGEDNPTIVAGATEDAFQQVQEFLRLLKPKEKKD